MHFLGTDLDLYRLSLRADYYRMNRLITIRFRRGNIVVKLFGNMLEVSMHGTQRRVAILQSLGNDPHRPDIKQLLEGQALFLHLFPDAVDVFWPPVNLGFDVFVIEEILQRAHHVVDIFRAFPPFTIQLFGYLLISSWVQIAKG